MTRRDASRYARWSALLALALAGITGGIYVHRLWVAHREKQNAPAPLPQNEEKQFTALRFKKVEGKRTIFDLEASKSTDLRGQDISLLEDVKIKVVGKNGDRNDVIHTQSCRYAKTDGSIQCEGKVQFELQSAEDAARAAANSGGSPNIIHIDTTGVTFERATGRAQTVQPVKFSFPNGGGDGVGAVYQSEQGQLRLIGDVQNHSTKGESTLHADKLTAYLSPQGWTNRIVAEGKVQGTSPSGNLQADTGEMEMWPGVNQAKLLTLRGNARVNGRDPKSGMTRSLASNAVQLTFAGGKAGAANRVQHAETLERGEMEWLDAAAVRSKLAADKLALDFSAQGKPQLLNATGSVQSQREIPGRPTQTASSATGVAQLSAAGDWSQITLRGNVRLQEARRKAEAPQAG